MNGNLVDALFITLFLITLLIPLYLMRNMMMVPVYERRRTDRRICDRRIGERRKINSYDLFNRRNTDSDRRKCDRRTGDRRKMDKTG